MQSRVYLNKTGGGAGVAALTASYTNGTTLNGPSRRLKIRVQATKHATNTGIKIRLVDVSAPATGAPTWSPLAIPVVWSGSGSLTEIELCAGGTTTQQALGYVDLYSDLHDAIAVQAEIDGADLSSDNTCIVEITSSGYPLSEA